MIYLDNQASTPCDPKVIEAIAYTLRNCVGNPSSNHDQGELASGIIEEALTNVAEIVNAEPGEILLTSGATESNNLAILGFADGFPSFKGQKKIITTLIEHKSVLAPIKHLENNGWSVEYLPLNSDGSIQLDHAVKSIADGAAFISIQLANSEIGTIQPVKAIAEIAQSNGVVFHCDASQAVGKIPVDTNLLGVDLLSFSAHKIYGPQGIGALWIRPGFEKILSPLIYGGGNKLRPGTIPVALVAGFGAACEILTQNFEDDYNHVLKLRDHFEMILCELLPEIIINGSGSRLPNNSNITFQGADADALLSQMVEVIASTSSACESGSIEPSRVLTAIGIAREAAYSTIRFGFGRFNTEAEITEAVYKIVGAYKTIVEFS